MPHEHYVLEAPTGDIGELGMNPYHVLAWALTALVVVIFLGALCGPLFGWQKAKQDREEFEIRKRHAQEELERGARQTDGRIF